MKFAIFVATVMTMSHVAFAAVVPAGTVIPRACAQRVHTQAKVGTPDVVLAKSICRAQIEGENKDYYTVDADVWEVLHNKISPPQVALVGKMNADRMVIWNANTRVIIGSVEDDQNEIRLYEGKRTIIGEDLREVLTSQSN